MATRLKPLKLGEAPDPAVNGIIWGNHFNITMRVDTDPDSAYPHHLAYAEARG